VEKPIKDLKVGQVALYRYRCTGCSRTFRHYPQGVDSHDQSQRLRGMAALL
jgi:rRNA maturation endonuclease Nob1